MSVAVRNLTHFPVRLLSDEGFIVWAPADDLVLSVIVVEDEVRFHPSIVDAIAKGKMSVVGTDSVALDYIETSKYDVPFGVPQLDGAARVPYTHLPADVLSGVIGPVGPSPAGLKTSGLAILSGVGLSGLDLVGVIDVSDTTMAPTGTNKRMTVDEFVNGITRRNVQVFTTPGAAVWTKPDWADATTLVEIFCLGGGAGGGSGAKLISTSISGGGSGGGSGGLSTMKVLAGDLGATENLSVGNGGAGGVSQTANSFNGFGGTVGVASYFGGTTTTNAKVRGNPGLGGLAGTPTGSAGGAAGGGTFGGAAGGAAAAGGTVGSTGPGGVSTAGGGGGGGTTAANVAAGGGAGGVPSSAVSTTGAVAGAVNTSGNNGWSLGTISTGGSGGGGSVTGNAGTGGDGGRGSGGGGGGGAVNSIGNSGAGGDGGPGLVMVVTG